MNQENQSLKVSIRSIVVDPQRGRKVFNRIDELAESIKKLGFINPILCTENPDKPGTYRLIAGERRFRGAVLAGLKEIPITFRENVSPLEYKIIELEENIQRQDLDWQEEAELHRQINELKQAVDATWTQKKTAELVQIHPTHLSNQIKIARTLKERPELKEKIKGKPMPAALKILDMVEKTERATRLQEQGRIKITTDLRLGDCRKLIRALPDASIDLLVTDPPYGLEKLEALRESSNNKMTGHQMMSEHHNQTIDQVLTLLTELAPEIHRVLKPGAHFYVFTAVQYVGDFIRALSPLEFQPPVLAWDRGKPTTPGYGYNYLNRLEYIIYGYKAPRSRRLAKEMYNVLVHPEVPRNLRVYPTEKPQSLLRDLISQSSIPGETVLDLFAGSASTLKAARSLGRRSIGFEINDDSWRQAQLILSGQDPSAEPSLLPDEQPDVLSDNSRFSVEK